MFELPIWHWVNQNLRNINQAPAELQDPKYRWHDLKALKFNSLSVAWTECIEMNSHRIGILNATWYTHSTCCVNDSLWMTHFSKCGAHVTSVSRPNCRDATRNKHCNRKHKNYEFSFILIINLRSSMQPIVKFANTMNHCELQNWIIFASTLSCTIRRMRGRPISNSADVRLGKYTKVQVGNINDSRIKFYETSPWPTTAFQVDLPVNHKHRQASTKQEMHRNNVRCHASNKSCNRSGPFGHQKSLFRGTQACQTHIRQDMKNVSSEQR